MELTLGLQYSEQQQPAIAGAFIHGHTAEIWLREINSWGISMNQLKALLVAANKQSVTAAGLFVLLPQTFVTPASNIRHPYQLLGGKLFIPVDATLTPAITTPELSRLLIWDWQLFHPAIGFIGFEEKDIINISDLLLLTAPQPSDWEYARMGIAPRIKLNRIGVSATETDIFSELKTIIGNQPLSALPDKVMPQQPALSFFQKIRQLLMGLLNRTFFKKTDDLEEKRKQELEKLLRMFDHDEDTALQYALPLDSPYAQRGSADPGASLQRHDASFSLRGLGGGGAVDAWDTGNYTQHLRRKYEQAAKAAIAAGEFKKAAYIYAHLLGDYSTATNVLEQGGYYREAAVMYATHLQNPGAAARCLEQGGLLLEAIDIYKTLTQFEKAADLHVVLDQQHEAITLYNKAAQVATDNNDILSAARIMQLKLQDVPQARQSLLNGWNQHIQTDACMQQYLALSRDNLAQELVFIYKNHLPAALENNFLLILNNTVKQYQQEEVTATATDMAYEIISKQSLQGNTANLRLLNSFVPDDRLLQNDCNRFINNLPKALPISQSLSSRRFAADVKWRQGILLGDDLLLIGCKTSGIYLLRYNLINHWAYTLWPGNVPEHLPPFTLVSDARYSNRLLIQHQLPFELGTKVLEAQNSKEGFEREVIAGSGSWLPKELIGYCFTESHVITLHTVGAHLIFSGYTHEGVLKGNQHCTTYSTNKAFLLSGDFRREAQKLIYWYGSFYLFLANYLYKMDFQGRLQVVLETDYIHEMSAGYNSDKLGVVVATSDSILWITWYYGDVAPKLHGSIANNRAGTRISYLPHEFIVAYNGNVAQVYHIADNEVILSHQIVAGDVICTVVALPKNNHVAIVEENGALSVYDLRDNGSVQ